MLRGRRTCTRAQALPALLQQRIMLLDGVMGTMIQQRRLSEAQFRGERFVDHPGMLKGHNELLNQTQPQVVREINVRAAALAREACDRHGSPWHPRFVAGAIGPTPRAASISPDVDDPAARKVSFDELRAAYREQGEGLLEGGADMLLVETFSDTLNAKTAAFAIEEVFEASGERLPVILSGTVTDASGRALGGRTVPVFWHSVRHVQPLAVGLSCAMGATPMRPFLAELARVADDTFVSCYPNAGLPNPMSETGFDETPEVTSRLLGEFAKKGLVNLVGGCCGTTPEHIAAIRQAIATSRPRTLAARSALA